MGQPVDRTGMHPDPESGSALITPQRRNFIFVAVLLGMLLAALDQTIVATALPTVVADLGGAGHQSWVVTSYLLASTIVTAVVGKLGDLFGRKAIFQVGGRLLPGRLGAVRHVGVDEHAGGLPRAAGHRRRRAHGDRDGSDRRGHPAARPRPLPGCARRGVRRHHRHRAAAGRVLHRPPDLALGLLDQHPGGHRRVDRRRGRHPAAGPVSRGGSPQDRLRRHPVRRRGGVRPDPGDELGRYRVRLDLAHDHRAVRRFPCRTGHFHPGRDARGRTDPADQAVPQRGVHGVLHPGVHRRIRDARRDDVPSHLHAVRRRGVGHRVGPAHAADGGRAC